MSIHQDSSRLCEAYDLLRSGKIEDSLKLLRAEEAAGNEYAVYYIGHIFSGNYQGYFNFELAEQKLMFAEKCNIEIAKKELGYLYFREADFEKSAFYLKKATENGDIEASYWNYLALVKSNSDDNEIYRSLKKSFDMDNPYAVRAYSLNKIRYSNIFEKFSYLYHYFRSMYLFLKFESIEKNLIE